MQSSKVNSIEILGTSYNRAHRYMILTITFALPIFVYCWFLLKSESLKFTEMHLNVANAILVFVYFWSIYTWLKVTKNYLSLYFFFLVYCFFSNAGQTLLQFFPNPGYSHINIYTAYSKSYILRMVVFQIICVLAMHIGALISCAIYNKKNTGEIIITNNVSFPTIINDLLFTIASIISIIDSIQQFQLRMQYSYGDYYYYMRESSSPYLLAFFYISMISYYFCNYNDKTRKTLIYAVAFIQSFIMLLVGRRSTIIPILASLAFLSFLTRPRYLSRKKVVLYILASFVFLAVSGSIAELRSHDLNSILSGNVKGIVQKGLFYRIGDVIQEMGSSARTILLTMHRNDIGIPHQSTIFYDFIQSFIPQDVLDAVGIYEPTIAVPSAWITYHTNSSSGLGYSIIAEAYLNYGYSGFIFTGIYGFIVSYLELYCIKKSKEGKILVPTLIIYVLANQIFYARAHFGLATSRIRISFILMIVYYFYKKIKKSDAYSNISINEGLK